MAIDHQVVYYLNLVLGIPGIILNLLTVMVLFKVKNHLVGPHLILLSSLAFADLMVCILALVKTTSKPNLPQDASWSTCLFDALFEQCSFAYTATFLTLILIAVNQYIAITEALRYNQLVTGRRLRTAVALVWIASLLIHCIDLVRALIISQMSDEDENSFCYILEQFKNWEKVTIPWKVFVALVGVGFIALSVIYIKIFIVARSSLKQSEAFSPDVNQQRKTKRHSLYTSLLLLGTFLIVYVPYCTVYATQEVYQSKLSAKKRVHDEALVDFEKQIKQLQDLQDMQEAKQLTLEGMGEMDASGQDHYDYDLDHSNQYDQLTYDEQSDKMLSNLSDADKLRWEARNVMRLVEGQLRLITSYMEPILLLNAICDPLIYMIKITTIRNVFKHMICYLCRKTSADPIQ